MDIKFDKDSGAYLRTTENINGYYDTLDFKNKKVLTVIGSSDHIFNAIIRGAKEVDGFDISINAILFYYLKEAAIKALSFEDYVNFFYVESTCFSREKYKTIRTMLNETVVDYWDNIFENETLKPIDNIRGMLMSKPLFYISYLTAEYKMSVLSSYLNENEYNKLKILLNDVKVNIKKRDIFDISGINKLYDYIVLSNIFEYHDVEKFKRLIDHYRNYLTEDGTIIVGYAYSDKDLSDYSEYEILDIPSRFVSQTNLEASSDHIIKTGKR